MATVAKTERIRGPRALCSRMTAAHDEMADKLGQTRAGLSSNKRFFFRKGLDVSMGNGV